MRKILAIGLCVASLSGCWPFTQPRPQFVADLSYVKASGLGYQNSGLLSAGYLYLWDTADNSLRLLSKTVPLTPKNSTSRPATIVSSGVSGVSVDGSFGSGVTKTAVSAAVGQQIEFRAENAIRQDYSETITALASQYRDGQARGEDLYGQWYVAEATRPKSSLYYVVIDSVVLADKTRIAQTGIKGDNDVASVTVTAPGLTKPVVVAIKSGAFTECSGMATACFFDAQIYKPYITEQKLLNFRIARGVDPDRLIAAFRRR